MSTQALAAVIEHSPYKGAAFAVHMIIADVVNPQNGNKFWMSFNSTAKRARITRRAAINAVKTMLEDGMLILVEKRDNNSNIYQFVLPDSMDFSLDGGEQDALGGEQLSPEVVNTVPVASEPRSPKPNKNPKGTQSNRNEAEVIYGMYPRRVGKGGKHGAIAAITKALKFNSFEKLLERTKQYAEMVADKEKQFIPYPSTWFNQERYNDDPDEWMDNEAKQKKINQLKHRLEYETDPATWEQLKQQIKILQQ